MRKEGSSISTGICITSGETALYSGFLSIPDSSRNSSGKVEGSAQPLQVPLYRPD